jgi:hypothetical protein
MKGMRGGIWAGLLVGTFAIGACGGGVDDDHETATNAGGGGEPATTSATGGDAGAREMPPGGEATTCPPISAASGGESGNLPDPTGCNDQVIQAAERSVDLLEVVVDEQALAGHAFDLASSLCPEHAWPNDSDGQGGASLATFYVRAAQTGGLELVTSTGDHGTRELQVTPLHRSAHGWDAWNVNTCARLEYDFEDTFATRRQAVSAMHLVFWRETPDAELQARVAVADELGPIVSDAAVDTTAPNVERIEIGGLTQGIDNIDFSTFKENFVFSEPLAADSEVTVTDQTGAAVAVTYTTVLGYKLGFRFDDAILTAKVQLHALDLAGNVFDDTLSLPVVELATTTGDFETESDFIDMYAWPLDPQYLDNADCEGFDVSVGGVPPIAGSRSFLFGAKFSNCAVAFRMTRPAGTTEVAFDARSIGEWELQAPPSIELCVSSLAAGGDKACTKREITWQPDPAFDGAADPVSLPQTLTFASPDDGDDVLVTIDTQQPLWLDSLRMQ